MSIDSTSETAIFERLVLPTDPGLSQEAARSLLAVGFGPDDTKRMHELAEKARQESLSPDERREIDNYESVGPFSNLRPAWQDK